MVYFWDNKSSYFCASSHPELTWQLPNQERQLSIPATAQIQKKKLGGEGCYYVLPSSAPSGYHSAQSQTWRVPPPVGRRHPCPPCLPSPAQFSGLCGSLCWCSVCINTIIIHTDVLIWCSVWIHTITVHTDTLCWCSVCINTIIIHTDVLIWCSFWIHTITVHTDTLCQCSVWINTRPEITVMVDWAENTKLLTYWINTITLHTDMLVFSMNKHNRSSHGQAVLVFSLNKHNDCSHR